MNLEVCNYNPYLSKQKLQICDLDPCLHYFLFVGNEGFRVGKKVANIPAYRQSFADGYFKGVENSYDYSDDIAGASARPFGTTFEGKASCAL